MHPDPATVLRRRHAVIMVLRLASLVIGVAGCTGVAVRLMLLTGFFIGFGSNEWVYLAPTVLGVVVFGGAAAGLAMASRPLATWIVPGSLHGCPACGYATSDHASTCPECGTCCQAASAASSRERRS